MSMQDVSANVSVNANINTCASTNAGASISANTNANASSKASEKPRSQAVKNATTKTDEVPQFTPGLVSVVTPCYNGESFLDRYFEGILAQTYRPIEVVLIDDGSTDATYSFALSYKEKLEKQGIRFVCIHQENKGQAAAINRGLPEVTGEFIAWPDSDDLMYPDNLERKVSYLCAHPDVGFVCCQVDRVHEGSLNKVVSVDKVSDPSNPWIFDALIRDKGVYCLDIAYLARTEALFTALGGRRIVESPAGQNYQLLLPLAYCYRCGFIDEPLVAYVAREGSHSNSFTSFEAQIERIFGFEELLHKVIRAIPMTEDERELYERYIDTKFLPRRFVLCAEFNEIQGMNKAKRQLDQLQGRSFAREVIAFLCRLHLGGVLPKIARAFGKAKSAFTRINSALKRTQSRTLKRENGDSGGLKHQSETLISQQTDKQSLRIGK